MVPCPFRKSYPGIETNTSEKAGSSWRTRIIVAFSSRMISQSVIAVAVAKRNRCPVRHLLSLSLFVREVMAPRLHPSRPPRGVSWFKGRGTNLKRYKNKRVVARFLASRRAF